MKLIKLTEASSTLSPLDKMRLFNQGQRRENIKACSPVKLLVYYRICLDNNLRRAEDQIATELLNRGLGAYVAPRVHAVDSSQFTPYEAQYILANKDDPDKIIDAAIQHPFPRLTESETLTVYLIWGIVLDVPQLVLKIKALMLSNQTYFNKMPIIIQDILALPGVEDIITDIISKLPNKSN